MKIITFTKELILLVQSGQKTQTRRKVRMYHNPPHHAIQYYKEGDVCLIKNSRFKSDTFGYLRIISVETCYIEDITEADAIAEGFNSKREFLNKWNNLHRNLSIGYPIIKIVFQYTDNYRMYVDKAKEQ